MRAETQFLVRLASEPTLPIDLGLHRPLASNSSLFGDWYPHILVRQILPFCYLPLRLLSRDLLTAGGPQPCLPYLDPNLAPGLARLVTCLGLLALSCSQSQSDPPTLLLSWEVLLGHLVLEHHSWRSLNHGPQLKEPPESDKPHRKSNTAWRRVIQRHC